jgi:GNAT superfamily N-acetyltransferase
MQNIRQQIQPYEIERDARALMELWRASLGKTWSLSGARIQKVLAHGPEPQHFVLWENGRLIGFVATFMGRREEQNVGYLAALVVAPDRQHQGVGTALHDFALDRLRDTGVQVFRLGSLLPRFWCGVPLNLPPAVSFFRKNGWEYSDPVYDMVMDISSYQIDPRIVQRMQKEQITIEPATSDNITEVLAFEAREFPNWLRAHFEPYADLGDYRDILAARDHDGRVIGTLVMYSPQSHPARMDIIWQDLLGEDAGGMGAVGVAANERGRGVGLALVAYGNAILRERGVRKCLIDWLVINDFYARVGYENWCTYYMGSHQK